MGLELARSGTLVDHAGRPLTVHICLYCGARLPVSGSVCPATVACPLHADRITLAERREQDLLAAGTSYVPALWPTATVSRCMHQQKGVIARPNRAEEMGEP